MYLYKQNQDVLQELLRYKGQKCACCADDSAATLWSWCYQKFTPSTMLNTWTDLRPDVATILQTSISSALGMTHVGWCVLPSHALAGGNQPPRDGLLSFRARLAVDMPERSSWPAEYVQTWPWRSGLKRYFIWNHTLADWTRHTYLCLTNLFCGN